jgi:hypothetical protein
MNAGPVNTLADSGGLLNPSSQAPSKFKTTVLTILLQTSHRLGSVALLATIGTWAVMYMIKDFHIPLAITAICANLGLCCGLSARMMTQPLTSLRREANGVTVFNLILFVLAIHLMLFARLDVIRSAASQFFTPSPYHAPHS